MSAKKILVVGAGFSGAVLARELAELDNLEILVIDERNHVAGNCHTERDEHTGVMVHRYGPHIFNTDWPDVWEYAKRFAEFGPYINRVKADTGNGIFSLPINLHTINQFFGTRFNPAEAKAYVENLGDKTIINPETFEEQALRFLGKELYEAFFLHYTIKQWGCHPRELPASILKRLPVRFNYNDSYYGTRYQGIPLDGFTSMIQRILDHPNIHVKTNCPFDKSMEHEFQAVVYSGQLDQYFNHSLGKLSYRTVYWDRIDDTGDFQGNAVINYTGPSSTFTRIHEHKHFAPWEEHQKTCAFVEFSKETTVGDIPYYPLRLSNDQILLKRYIELARNQDRVFFLGRLATYRYLNMDAVIKEALDFAPAFIRWLRNPSKGRPETFKE